MELAAAVIYPKNNNCIHQRRVKLSIIEERKLINNKYAFQGAVCFRGVSALGGVCFGGVSASGGCLLLGGVCFRGVSVPRGVGVSAPRGSASGGVSASKGCLLLGGVSAPSMH